MDSSASPQAVSNGRETSSTSSPPAGKSEVTDVVYVNPKQWKAIERRRATRAKVDARRVAKKPKYLHESRHKYAMCRPRGPGGQFLPKAEAMKLMQEEVKEGVQPKGKRGSAGADSKRRSVGKGRGRSSNNRKRSGDDDNDDNDDQDEDSGEESDEAYVVASLFVRIAPATERPDVRKPLFDGAFPPPRFHTFAPSASEAVAMVAAPDPLAGASSTVSLVPAPTPAASASASTPVPTPTKATLITGPATHAKAPGRSGITQARLHPPSKGHPTLHRMPDGLPPLSPPSASRRSFTRAQMSAGRTPPPPPRALKPHSGASPMNPFILWSSSANKPRNHKCPPGLFLPEYAVSAPSAARTDVPLRAESSLTASVSSDISENTDASSSDDSLGNSQSTLAGALMHSIGLNNLFGLDKLSEEVCL